MKVKLVVDKGPAAGTAFALAENSYVAIGRVGPEVTMTLSASGDDRPLDTEDLTLVAQHLQRRKKMARPGFNASLGAFRRDPDVLLDDDKISRTHAMFFLDDEGASIVDLLSTNGTHVNGEAINDAELSDGDIVHIGRTRMIVHIEED